MSCNLIEVLAFCVTLKCDKYCRMCCVTSKKEGAHMPFSTLLTGLDKLEGSLAPNPIIGLTGGEPFLYEDAGVLLPDIVRILRERDFTVDIQTSCWDRGDSIYEERFEMLKPFLESGKITINLSYNLYQKPGAEDRLKNTLQVLWGSGLTPDVYMVIDLRNGLDSFARFYELAESLGLEPDVPLEAVVQGFRELNIRAILRLISFAGKQGSLRMAASPVQKVGRGRSVKAPTVKTVACGFVKGDDRSLEIYPDGSVSPCRVPHSIVMHPIGNILTHSAQEILTNHEARRQELSAHLAQVPDGVSICEICTQYRPPA